jgi:hypothetical protein
MSMVNWDDIATFALSPGPDATQTKRIRAYVKIDVDGKDITNRLEPYLISVQIKDGATWQAILELDDRDGRLDIPPINKPQSLQINLGWTSEKMVRVFNGQIIEVEHGFGRKAGGRRMFVHGSGLDQSGMIKSPIRDSIGEGAGPGQSQGSTNISFAEAAQKFVAHAGLTISIGPSFQNIVRDYWSINNESPMQWLSHHGSDLGAWWRVEDNNVVFYGVKDFTKPTILARWGDNMIGWKIHPYAARSSWSGSSQQYFEDRTGKWLDVVKKFGLRLPWGAATGVYGLPVPAPNAQIGNQQNQGAMDANWMKGHGRIIINGEPQASWGGKAQVIGARPGVDGIYYIETADHSWSRQGYVTTLEVRPDINTTTNNIGAAYGPPVAPAFPTSATVINLVRNPDGSVTYYFSDGTITTVSADGITSTSPDGTTTTLPPPTPPISQPDPVIAPPAPPISH